MERGGKTACRKLKPGGTSANTSQHGRLRKKRCQEAPLTSKHVLEGRELLVRDRRPETMSSKKGGRESAVLFSQKRGNGADEHRQQSGGGEFGSGGEVVKWASIVGIQAKEEGRQHHLRLGRRKKGTADPIPARSSN